MESALTISPPTALARRIDRSVFPTAVGPVSMTSGGRFISDSCSSLRYVSFRPLIALYMRGSFSSVKRNNFHIVRHEEISVIILLSLCRVKLFAVPDIFVLRMVKDQVLHAQPLRQLAGVLDRGVILLVRIKDIRLGIEAERLMEQPVAAGGVGLFIVAVWLVSAADGRCSSTVFLLASSVRMRYRLSASRGKVELLYAAPLHTIPCPPDMLPPGEAHGSVRCFVLTSFGHRTGAAIISDEIIAYSSGKIKKEVKF